MKDVNRVLMGHEDGREISFLPVQINAMKGCGWKVLVSKENDAVKVQKIVEENDIQKEIMNQLDEEEKAGDVEVSLENK